MQLAKNVYGSNVSDMDAWKEVIESSYPMSGMEGVESPSVPGMNVEGTYSCEVTADGVKGAGRVLYGETDYAYYCILYAAPKINDNKAAYFINVCASFKEMAPEIENASTVETTDTIQWINNTFADDMEYLVEVGVADVAEEERGDFLLENFDVDVEEAESYAAGLAFYEQYGENAIAAWDYSRAMSLLGYYYLAGYYTEEEALDKAFEVAQTIQGTFDSWDGFMESYFEGYEYWAGESSDERRGIYEEIKAASDNPYSIDWNLTLEKSW